jgi:Tfp pilus assembly protein PilX
VSRRIRGDRGSATAELAIALPALILLLLFALGAVDAVLTRMRCVDAARDAALVQARGGDGAAAARRRAPDNAAVSIWSDGDLVHATVSVTVRPLGHHLPGLAVSGDAVAEVEP